MNELIEFLLTLNRLQETLGHPCYFVGGCVRDALLNIGALDLDLAVDGPVGVFSKALGGASLSQYETARFTIGNCHAGCHHVDMASFRSDTYENASGLPQVDKADWDADLARRDFTVNTAYVPLNERTIDVIVRGKQLSLSDVVKAHPLFEKDLSQRLIRALKEHTFDEDPSRMLRAIKYKVTLGFSIEKHTAEWMNRCDKHALMEAFSDSRFKRILHDYCHHDLGYETITELAKEELLKNHLNADSISERMHIQLLESTERVKVHYGKVVPGIVALLALYKNRLTYWFDSNKAESLPAKGLNKLLAQFEAGDDYNDMELYRRFNGLEPEAMAVCLSKDLIGEKIHTAAEHYFSVLKDIKLMLNGRDVMALGFDDGPVIGAILADLLAHQVENHLNLSKEEEIKWIASKMNAYRY